MLGRHRANQDRRHHIPKQRHRVTNWAAYDVALRQRGSPTVWFTEAAIAAWKAEPRAMRGGQPCYSALAITTALTLRTVFRLALRQTEGLIASLLRLLGLDLAAPDHSTISRRSQMLDFSSSATSSFVMKWQGIGRPMPTGSLSAPTRFLCSSPIRNSRRGLRRFVGMRWDVGGRSKSPTVIDGIRPGNRVRTGLPAGGSWIRTIGPSRQECCFFADETAEANRMVAEASIRSRV
jgi:Transposase DDE domain